MIYDQVDHVLLVATSDHLPSHPTNKDGRMKGRLRNMTDGKAN